MQTQNRHQLAKCSFKFLWVDLRAQLCRLCAWLTHLDQVLLLRMAKPTEALVSICVWQ